MNDNDITKALECCRIGGDKCRFDCPYINAGTKNCVDDLLEDAINLINRQKAEVERLTLENKRLAETNNALNYQIDTFNPSEAIKGFAKKLKEKGFSDQYYEHESIIYVADIDDLVKEVAEAALERRKEGKYGRLD